jgi:hypothetical protein
MPSEGDEFLQRMGSGYDDVGGITIPDYNRELKGQWDNIVSDFKTAGTMRSYGPYASSSSLKEESNIGGVGSAISDFANSLDSAANGFGGGLFGNMGSSASRGMKSSRSGGAKEGSSRGGLIKQLLGIIMGVLSLPMRFMNIFQSLAQSGIALGLGVKGLGESTVLGIKDIFLLIVAIIKVFIKYFKCIVSFTLTTILGGCFIPHIITFLFYILYLIFPITSFLVYSASGFDLDPYIDAGFQSLHDYDDSLVEAGIMPFNVTKWPQFINMFCYMCFFEEVHLKDVLQDVMVVKQIGDLITHDFNVTMPRYLRPASKPAVSAKQHLDAALE